MTSSRHLKTEPKNRPRDDLKENPGIHGGRGTFATGMDPADIQGENTVEGDVENDTTPQGGVDPSQRAKKDR